MNTQIIAFNSLLLKQFEEPRNNFYKYLFIFIVESQDIGDRDHERQLPKSPCLPPALSPSRQRSPGTPPYTPPVYPSQSQIYQTYNTTGSPSIKTPPIGEVTTVGRNGIMPPTTNESRNDNSFVQNCKYKLLLLSNILISLLILGLLDIYNNGTLCFRSCGGVFLNALIYDL